MKSSDFGVFFFDKNPLYELHGIFLLQGGNIFLKKKVSKNVTMDKANKASILNGTSCSKSHYVHVLFL